MSVVIEQRPASVSARQACRQLGLARSSVQRQERLHRFCEPAKTTGHWTQTEPAATGTQH